MTAQYHKYIYDLEQKQIIGDFEGAYRDCDDVWPTQHAVHSLKYQDVLRRARQIGSHVRVLDIGAGYGDLISMLTAAGVDATGCEISPTAVLRGKERHGNHLRLEVGDLKRGLPYESYTFDIVVLFGLFWFLLDSIPVCLNEIRRLMKERGIFITSITIPDEPIGAEVISSHDDFISLIRQYFAIREVALLPEASALRKGDSIDGCETDLVVWCGL